MNLRALATTLTGRGHRVVMIHDEQRTDLVNPLANPAVYTWPSFNPRNPRPADIAFFYSLLRQYRPNCVVAEFSSVRLMSLLGWLFHTPQRVVWYHTLTSQIEMDVQMSAVRWLPSRIIRYVAHQLATHLIVVSQAAQDDAVQTLHISPDKCRLFYNSLFDPTIGAQAIKIPAFRQRRVVCVSRLFPSKGQAVLLQAVARLKDLPAFEVEFIGDGPQMAVYQELAVSLGIEQSCRFVGYLPHQQVMERMANALVTVVPSQDEAFGYMLIESLSVGTPVVASRVGGIPEIIRDGLDGFLTPAGDPVGLAEKLKTLLDNMEQWIRMSRNARRHFLEQFESTTQISRQADWLEEICRNTA